MIDQPSEPMLRRISVEDFARVLARHLARTIIESSETPGGVERVERHLNKIMKIMRSEILGVFRAHRISEGARR